MNKDLNTPIWQLTVGEFLDLHKEFERYECQQQEQKKPEEDNPRIVRGLHGLASLLNCSHTTAFKIKKSGIIDKAVSQINRTIIINADLAIELLHSHSNKKR